MAALTGKLITAGTIPDVYINKHPITEGWMETRRKCGTATADRDSQTSAYTSAAEFGLAWFG